MVALVLTKDDDGGGTSGDRIAAKFAEQLQDQTRVTDEQARCVGQYVVDEIGASRLQDVQDLQQSNAPADVQADVNQAVQRAFTECDVAQADLLPPDESGGTSGAVGTDATAEGSSTVPSGQILTESQYKDYYQQSLGLSEEDAACLAARSSEAEASGEIEQGDGVSQFYQWVDDCGIDPDELFQSIATADTSAGG